MKSMLEFDTSINIPMFFKEDMIMRRVYEDPKDIYLVEHEDITIKDISLESVSLRSIVNLVIEQIKKLYNRICELLGRLFLYRKDLRKLIGKNRGYSILECGKYVKDKCPNLIYFHIDIFNNIEPLLNDLHKHVAINLEACLSILEDKNVDLVNLNGKDGFAILDSKLYSYENGKVSWRELENVNYLSLNDESGHNRDGKDILKVLDSIDMFYKMMLIYNGTLNRLHNVLKNKKNDKILLLGYDISSKLLQMLNNIHTEINYYLRILVINGSITKRLVPWAGVL